MQKQTGSSLIEIMVTILIVSFGLLGVAGVIGNGLKNNHSSYARSQASWLAADIIDRMRANRIAAEATEYNLAIGTNPTGVSVAAYDLIAWRKALAATLPDGKGSINMDAFMKVTVSVQWDDSRGANGSSTQTFVTETRL